MMPSHSFLHFRAHWFAYGFVALVLAGCSNGPYVQGSRTSADLATVTTDLGPDPDDRNLVFTNVDGQRLSTQWVSRRPTEVQVTPGKHVLWVEFRHKSLKLEPRIVFTAVADARYQLHEASQGDGPRFWITRVGQTAPVPIEFLGRQNW